MTLWDALTTQVAATARHRLYWWDGESYRGTPWTDVLVRAERMTHGLRRKGIRPGARVATVLTNTGAAVTGAFAVWLAGGAVVSLPHLARGMSVEEYVSQLTRLLDHVEPATTMLDEDFRQLLPEDVRTRYNVHSWDSVEDSGTIEPAPPALDEMAFLQFSSGSTMQPKGCVLTARAIERQLHSLAEMFELAYGKETMVGWAPLSHDMGFFGVTLLSWLMDAELYLSSPQRFALAPRTWLGDVVETGATITLGTNTGLALAVRRHRPAHLNGRQIKLHTLALGAERVHWPTLDGGVTAFGPYGLGWDTYMPAYGMAETVLAVTHTPRDEKPRMLSVDTMALADGQLVEVDEHSPQASHIVSSGRPCRGVELLNVEGDRVSELYVRSPSVAEGYFNRDELTRERFRDGTFATRDLAFVRDGWLYPAGRVDDMLSLGGRKVYAGEVESAVDGVTGFRRGCSTLVDARNGSGPRLTLLVELQPDALDYDSLAVQAAEVAMRKSGVPLDACVLLARGTLPKTPSGKVQRFRCRDLLAAGRFTPVASVDFTPPGPN
jgi:fatty-acyl-CoA synthase